MKAIDAIRIALDISDRDIRFIEGMRDEPLTQPTQVGGNHPLWILGHLTWAEGNIPKIVHGEPNPVAHWAPLFDWGSEPTTDASVYPPFDELLRTYRELRARNLALLSEIGEDGLDGPSKNPPPGLESGFGTVGQTFLTMASHQSFHGGQASVARRAGGHKPFFVLTEALRQW